MKGLLGEINVTFESCRYVAGTGANTTLPLGAITGAIATYGSMVVWRAWGWTGNRLRLHRGAC